MIELYAEISLESGGGNITTKEVNHGGLSGRDKFSRSVTFNEVKSTAVEGGNPWIVDVTPIENLTVGKEIDYYIGSEFADENGSFKYPYLITLLGVDISSVTITFDTFNNQYPTTIILGDGTEMHPDDPIVAIDFAETANEQTLLITGWSAPNFPLKVYGVSAGIANIIIDRKNMISCSRSISDRADFDKPSFGVISNMGQIEFNDTNGEVADYAEMGLLVADLPVAVYLRNTLANNRKGAKQLIAKFYTQEWDYDTAAKIVSVSLADGLTKYQNTSVAAQPLFGISEKPNGNTDEYFPYGEASWTNQTLYYLWAGQYGGGKYKMGDTADAVFSDVVANSRYYKPQWEEMSRWSFWNAVANAANAHIYVNENGKTVMEDD